MSGTRQLLLVMIIGLSLTGTSCQKSSDLKDRLIGTWELYRQDGGFIGTLIYPAGNGNRYQFRNDGSVTISTPASTFTGKYQLQPSFPISTDRILSLTWSGSGAASRDSVRITDGLLTFLLRGSCCDVPSDLVYRRIQ